jgi:hypothetical protein
LRIEAVAAFFLKRESECYFKLVILHPRTRLATRGGWLKSGTGVSGRDSRPYSKKEVPNNSARVQDMIYRGESLLKGFKKETPLRGWRGVGMERIWQKENISLSTSQA